MAGEAELVDGEAEQEEDAGDVGFGFGDGYDEGARASEITVDESTSDGVEARVPVEADFREIISREICGVGKDQIAGILPIVDFCSPLGGSAPVPDGQFGSGGGAGPGEAAEAQDAGESFQIDDGVGAEREGSDILVEISTYGQCAAVEVDVCIAVHSIGDCNEEGTAVEVNA